MKSNEAMKNVILHELREHAPFTVGGALLGIVLMAAFHNIPYKVEYALFYIFHPLHVVLSALVTTSMYRNYKCSMNRRECNLLWLLIVGYAGSIGVATLSDSLIPYWGELLLRLPNAQMHIGFLEEWWIVLPVAGIGIGIAYFRPTTKSPHAGHVLVSTWASLFHVLMAIGASLNLISYVFVFMFLFIAVWLPCCFGDIVFPLLFVGRDNVLREKKA